MPKSVDEQGLADLRHRVEAAGYEVVVATVSGPRRVTVIGRTSLGEKLVWTGTVYTDGREFFSVDLDVNAPFPPP